MKNKLILLMCAIVLIASALTIPTYVENNKAKTIITREKNICITDIKLVDKYVQGKWYCYYVYADGDVYVITLKRNHVQKCVMLN